MPKVQFDNTKFNTEILVDGQVVGFLSGKKEVYVIFKTEAGEDKVIARFKYKSPVAGAKDWLKFILARMTTLEIIEALKDWKQTPLGLAMSLGYVSLNERNAKKQIAELKQRQAVRSVVVVTMADIMPQ